MNEATEERDGRFERFYAEYFPKVRNFAWLLTKSDADAEDIAQSIFLKLWMRPDLWESSDSMSGYLYTVTKHEIFALFKHQQLEKAYEERMIKAHLLDELYADNSAPLEDLYYKEKLMLIEMALKRMPPARREVFELSRFEGLPNKKIAERLNMPLRTVEDHIYKTLIELRKVLMFVILFRLFP